MRKRDLPIPGQNEPPPEPVPGQNEPNPQKPDGDEPTLPRPCDPGGLDVPPTAAGWDALPIAAVARARPL